MCKTTELGLHPQPDIAFANPAHCPVNGFGGSWYHQPFSLVPVYNRGAPGVVDYITWATIDEWAAIVANVWVTTGTCLGLCLATLAYIIALTPNKKRGMPFHTSLMLALIFEIGRLLCDLGRASNVGLSPYSAYLGITNDFAASSSSVSFQVLEIAGMSCATLAFFSTVVCLYIQAFGLLTGLQMRQRIVYIGTIGYLVTVSAVALALRITLVVMQSLYLSGRAQEFTFESIPKVHRATAIAYAVCLGSWCSVSLASVLWLMFTRSKLIVSNRPYDTALTILSLVFMESFIVPIVFVVLQAFPETKFPVAELVVIPSVLVLLPMGSLFMTVHTVEVRNNVDRADEAPPDTGHNALPELESRPLVNSQSTTMIGEESQPSHMHFSDNYPLKTLSTPAIKPLAANPVDRELRAIDNMEEEEGEPVFGSAETDSVLQARARKIRKALEARKQH